MAELSSSGRGKRVRECSEGDDASSLSKKKTKTLADKELETLMVKLNDKNLHSDIEEALCCLCEDLRYALAVLTIKSCNGTTGYGVPFSAAFCDTDTYKNEYHPFCSMFTKGMLLLYECLKNPDEIVEQESSLLTALKKLLYFITDQESVKFMRDFPLMSIRSRDNETVMAVVMTEHVLRKLAVHGDLYRVDCKYMKTSNDECECGCKTLVKDRFGNTCIGDPTVWHGNLDVVLGDNGNEVPIVVAIDDNPGELTHHYACTPVDDSTKLKKLKLNQAKDKIIAQNIVFSFLQKTMYPNSEISLIPTIGISPTEVVFFFYDAKHDVLLQSVNMPLQVGKSACYSTVIALWLVLNYKYLGSGLTGMQKQTQKSNFFALAKDVLDVYNNKLQVGDISSSFVGYGFNPYEITASKLVWHASVPKCDF